MLYMEFRRGTGYRRVTQIMLRFTMAPMVTRLTAASSVIEIYGPPKYKTLAVCDSTGKEGWQLSNEKTLV